MFGLSCFVLVCVCVCVCVCVWEVVGFADLVWKKENVNFSPPPPTHQTPPHIKHMFLILMHLSMKTSFVRVL